VTTRTWTRTNEAGDTATLTLDAVGAAMSVRRIDGRREAWTASHEEFEAEWIAWLPPAFDDVADEIREALDAAYAGAMRDDDEIP
jgi:hypothetical protein